MSYISPCCSQHAYINIYLFIFILPWFYFGLKLELSERLITRTINSSSVLLRAEEISRPRDFLGSDIFKRGPQISFYNTEKGEEGVKRPTLKKCTL